MRVSVPTLLAIQTASAEAAVHDAYGTATRATILFVLGSMRTTGPDGPATHTEPNAQTTP